MPNRTEQTRRTARTIDTLRRLRGFTDQTLADHAGMSRSQIEARRSGRTAIDLDDLERIAVALDVPTPVLLMEPHEAVKYAAEAGVDLGFPLSGWLTVGA